jgi:hypothetical protein
VTFAQITQAHSEIDLDPSLRTPIVHPVAWPAGALKTMRASGRLPSVAAPPPSAFLPPGQSTVHQPNFPAAMS